MSKTLKVSIALMIVIAIGVFFAVRLPKDTSNDVSTTDQFVGGMPTTSWQILSDSSVAQNSNGSLKIMAALISEKHISLFYSIDSSFESTPKVVGTGSSKAEQKSVKQPQVVMIQTLNTANKHTIGVIQLSKEDVVGQEISLAIEVANGTKDVWTVTPLKQLQPAANSSVEFLSFPASASDSVIEIGQLGGADTLIKFKVLPPKKGSHAADPMLFFAMNRQMETQPIPEVDFAQRANPNQSQPNIPGAATPAPTQTR